MPRGRKLTPLTISEADHTQLQGVANSTTMPDASVLRARMILASAEGKRCGRAPGRRFAAGHRQVAQALSRRRHPRAARRTAPRPPRRYDDERVARVINRALQDKPPNAIH